MIEKFDKIKLRYLVTTIIMLFTCQVLRFFKVVRNDKISIVIAVFGLIGIIIYILDKFICNKRKIDKYDILIYLLILFGIISSIFAFNFQISIFGFQNRREGLLVIVTYYLLFLNTRNIENKKYRKVVFNFIVTYGLLHSIYAICQALKLENIFGFIPVENKNYYSTAFEGVSNFFGSIAITCLALVLSKFLFKEDKKSWISGAISVILFMGMLCSGAMSSALAFAIIIILLIVLLIIRKLKVFPVLVKIIIISVIFILCFNIFSSLNEGFYAKQIGNMSSEIGNVSKGNMGEQFGTGRIYIWKKTLEVVPKYILTGVGIDNFYYAFGEKALIDLKSNLPVDKAHNEYFQKLVTEGIFSAITYLALLFMAFVEGVKKIIKKDDKGKDYNLLISLFVGFCAYSIQAFFNISVICVAPIFYIIMGLLVGETNETN